jgi:tetratricopeptide (TPR) repeat protein
MNNKINPVDFDKQGKQAYKKKAYREAADFFQQASIAYASQDEALMAAEMANNWSVASLQAGDAQTALIAAEGTAEVFAEAGDLRRQGMALGNQAAALEAQGRLDEALLYYEQAAEILKEAGDHDTRLHVMQALSALQLRTGKQLQALATMQAGLENASSTSPKQKLLQKLLSYPNKFLTGK